ncbi:SDR family NAD(P)-dependent oxidoreductase [Kitasatospora sp. NPDC051914]|uniref:SDR family NAD(P)-dependent oxidoreductase n=1 Tax=Kitasatospora sp. NPDC051914 TaxID=3154945 RepID=UPI00343E8850
MCSQASSRPAASANDWGPAACTGVPNTADSRSAASCRPGPPAEAHNSPTSTACSRSGTARPPASSSAARSAVRPEAAGPASEPSTAAVTSGLAYAPKRSAPVYCATKAGLHTLLDALRYQSEAATPHVRVQEVVLPLVDTPMTAGREGPARKLTAEAAAEAVLRGLGTGRRIVPVGASRALLAVHRLSPATARRILRDA